MGTTTVLHSSAMKLVILSVLLGLVAADYSSVQFAAFKERHGKQYGSKAEMELRREVFKANLVKIEEHNQSGATWKKEVNEFSDLTEAEFESLYMGGYKKLPQSGAGGAPTGMKVKTRAELPDSMDWRDLGAVSAVKNQGQCGSCWAFCTTEQIESYAWIATGSLPELSSEQVTSCTPNPLQCGGTGGCMGSIPQLGYTYIQLFGPVAEADYPYTSGSTGDGATCLYDYSNTAPVVGITSYDSNIALNHAVQLVGYGSDTDGDYWIVRNSWGSSWGESGYIRLAREASAQCGTDSTPMDGTACVGGPGNDEQHVCGQCGVLFDVSWPLGAHDFAMP